jgi:glycosyltransferase involved in cell wall biosynthesis
MTNSKPTISVIMPVFNGEKYLRDAIDSILAQSYKAFELIVIDDGSTDHTSEILNTYGNNILVIRQSNSGIELALNTGLNRSQGKYIARMDADDLALVDRFKKQVEFLEEHPDIGMIGSYANLLDADGNELGLLSEPTSDIAIRWQSLFLCPFIHPSVMIRKHILTQNNLEYDPRFTHIGDYDLWTRLLAHTRVANLNIPLIKYRVHPASITSIAKEVMKENHYRVSERSIRQNFPSRNFTESELRDLCLEIGFPVESNAKTKKQRALLAVRYLDLWQAFSTQYADCKDIKKVEREAMIKAARMILYPPFQPGWLAGIRELSRLKPDWMYDFLASLPNGILARGRQLSLRRFRES